MDRERFSSLFRVGEIINSGGLRARLLVIAIEDEGVRYRSIRAKDPKYLSYSTLAVILRGFERIDPKAIQRTIQPVYLDAGLPENVWTENYEYGFAREFRNRWRKIPA
jgi:hypothetical protein